VTQAGVFDDTFDCIVGLAYTKMATWGTIPFFDNLMQSGILSQNIFSFYLSNSQNDYPSKLVFG
jgi:hypothetical protein